ncbi:LLM class flavin-dependent oxidoreductase [Sphingobium fuliginis]|jgi:FMNH2-dependent dimethyl sulfone monooxygenase|uniref:LLM class flavin-dependent oxidoreductase n=1 Tax=Sphingobium fuliginis (strain ATCC 27551) TaxID=336203 RepID=A0A7M2GNB7_SPHSA|nr:LLM class flavin-dependent oxidoreductase [Sphingobium fuliginis]QOT73915.1 LLM class flavin-dependent oxidoreductase [Sphingobium fuliginis]
MKLGIWTPLPHTIRADAEFSAAIAGLDERGGPAVPDASFEYALDMLQKGERGGFDISLVAERYLGPDLESWILATALAARTSKIVTMPAIHPGIINPQVVAKMGATMDRISGGRFALNIVNGWWEEEFALYGNGSWLESGDARYRRMDEFIQVVQGLWTGKPFTFEGEFFNCKEGLLPTQTIQTPPPLYAASRSEKGCDIIARTCHCWFAAYEPGYRNFEANLRMLERSIAEMKERARSYGRDIQIALNPNFILANTEAEANARADEIEEYGKSGQVNWIFASALGAGLVGTAELVAERIKAFEEIGVDLLMLRSYPMNEGIDRFIADVIPRIRD